VPLADAPPFVPRLTRPLPKVGSFAEGGIGKTRKQMHRFAGALQTVCIYLIIAALAACRGVSKPQEISGDMIGSVTSATINSAQTGSVYTLYIYLPASYGNGTATYPVIYATDGDAAFPPEGRFVNFTRILQRRGIDAILVGIGGTARRDKDYKLPGAKAYHEFITQELIPFVESRFRADPKRRILSGISYGGSFVVTSLFLEAPKILFFSHYISAEGSFFQPSFVAQEHNFSSTIGTKSIPATLILARGFENDRVQQQQQFSAGIGTKSMPAVVDLARSLNEATNSAAVNSLYRRMVNRHFVDLILVETHFATDHIGTDNPSFEDAVVRIFE
jgi:predicted alpha/beta superfamily hydrolase